MTANPARPQHLPPTGIDELAQHIGARIEADAAGKQAQVNAVSSTTCSVRPGALFVALPGTRTHGAKFATQAAQAGATAILTDETGLELAREAHLPTLIHPDPRRILGKTAALVYGTTKATPLLIGVTGTDGKTTTTYLVNAILRELGITSGLSSTVERRVGNASITTHQSGRLTTPEADDLHALTAAMREAKVEAAVIEVSAQATTQHRISGLFFTSAIFTGFSQDHLDYYGTMENYFQAKLALFTPEYASSGVARIDDEWGARLAAQAQVPITTLSTDAARAADWHITTREAGLERTEFTLTAPDGRTLSTWVNLPGSFVAIDFGLAVMALVNAGFAFERFCNVFNEQHGLKLLLPGRLDLVNPGGTGPRVYVDYAHTPDAFTQVLTTLRRFTTGRLFMVFGADGDRDKSKRPDMARAAAIADVVVVTDYNPRFEDPAAIRKVLLDTIRTEFPEREVYEIPDAADGVRKAVSLAGEGDIIFVGGHGHSDDIDVQGKLIPFLIKDAVRDALHEYGYSC